MERRRGTREMRIVHVRSDGIVTGLNEDGERVAEPKFGMLRLTFGRLAERSNACEVSMPSEWTGVVNSNNGDQEV